MFIHFTSGGRCEKSSGGFSATRKRLNGKNSSIRREVDAFSRGTSRLPGDSLPASKKIGRTPSKKPADITET